MTGNEQEVSPETRRERERVLRLPYECIQSIAAGMSDVRVWWDPNLQCERVGKRYDLSNLDDVLPEAATLQRIDHRNVVPILAAPDVDGYPAGMRVIEIVTPFYKRGSITDALLRGDRFRPTQAIQITQAALRGLGCLHEVHGILHRDIKSGNILLAEDDSLAKVADLGLAGELAADGTVPAIDNPTLYTPPELVATGVLTRPSDIFAMGLVLLELLNGPFNYESYQRTTVVERLMALRSPLSKADRTYPIWASRSVRRVLNKALHRNPNERFQTASDMDNAMSRVRVVDWQQADEGQWEAPFLHRPSHRIQVSARAVRGSGTRMSIRVDRGNGWRRCGVPDQDVPSLDAVAAFSVFDQATDIATDS
ncbi:serine/threonine-protein kinase [Mycobacterium marinum]|uniref:serine/threonine-protein kinase n=1 Tax=Mycobacterium marinum TaxID=1781 RepID=UPI000E3EDEFF|nr:serine/threonine-protein kinase [Mycobacterium marinum]